MQDACPRSSLANQTIRYLLEMTGQHILSRRPLLVVKRQDGLLGSKFIAHCPGRVKFPREQVLPAGHGIDGHVEASQLLLSNAKQCQRRQQVPARGYHMIGIFFPSLTKTPRPKNMPRPGAFGHAPDTDQGAITTFDHLEQQGLKFSVQALLCLVDLVSSRSAFAPFFGEPVLQLGETSIGAHLANVRTRSRAQSYERLL